MNIESASVNLKKDWHVIGREIIDSPTGVQERDIAGDAKINGGRISTYKTSWSGEGGAITRAEM